MIYRHIFAGDMDFTPLPVGKYTATVSQVESKMGPKTEYLAITFDIHHTDYEGRKVFYNAPFGTSFLDVLLVALGYEFTEGKELEFDTEEDQNWQRLVTLSIGHKTYEGRAREVVQLIEKIDGQDDGIAGQDDGSAEAVKSNGKTKKEVPF